MWSRLLRGRESGGWGAALGRWAPRFPPGFPGAGSQVRVRRAPPAVSTTKDEPERWAPGRSLQTRQPALREIQAFQVTLGKQASLMARMVKSLPARRETWVRSLGREDPLEKVMTTHSSTLAYKIPWIEEPGRLQSMRSQRVKHD